MTVPAVTYDRLKKFLAEEELNFDVDPDDGELIIGFPNCVFFMNVNEFTWRTTGLWRGAATDVDTAAALLMYTHNSNSARSFAKSYIGGAGSEDEPTKVFGETNCLVKEGLTDDQLAANFRNAMGSLFALFEDLESEFPQLVDWTEEG